MVRKNGLIILFLIIIFIIGYILSTSKSDPSQTTKNSVNDGAILDQLDNNQSITPTPSVFTDIQKLYINDNPVPFEMKQQCSDDANSLLTRLNQNSEKMEQAAKLKGHISSGRTRLVQAAFINSLNTCIAEVEEVGMFDGTDFTIYTIYDSLSGKELAVNSSTNPELNFVPTKYNSVTSIDYLYYKNSLGL